MGAPDRPVTQASMAGAVEEFHRRNAEARLIESHAADPLVRGLRLVATGRTRHPDLRPPIAPSTVTGRTSRPVYTGGAWTDAEVIDVSEIIHNGVLVEGPALVEPPFSTLVLRPSDTARATNAGDVLVDVGPAIP